VSKPYDASLNALIEAGPADWVNFLAPKAGLTPDPAEVLDTDLSVTAQADKAFRLAGPPAAILHVELEGNPRRGIPADLLRYNVLLGHGREEPVYSVIVLIRPKAVAADLTGVYSRPNLEFRYAVVKVWEESVESLLAGGPATAPLALLTDESVADPAGAVERFHGRLHQPDVDATLAKEVWHKAYVLGGLRHAEKLLADLFARYNMILEESTTYQGILAKGRVDALRELVLTQARDRFGSDNAAAEAAIRAIQDPARLTRIGARLLHAAGWDDLLTTP
jgi:hypothetical protein